MNHIYRLVWNASQQAYCAVTETAKGRGKSGGKSASTPALIATGLIAALSTPAWAGSTNALPTGGQVTAGSAAISSSANTLTVNQGSQKAAINWQSFNIGSAATVNFVQPNASAVTLNRVVGNEQSVIAGAMNANGKVFLLNSNGVLFNGTSSVNVGGLVASTLNMSDTDFMAGRNTFTANGSKASVINLGTITAADGGYVALLGNQVKNEGVITAKLGTAILAAGDQVSLNFNGDSLVGVTIDQGTLNALVDNKQAIRADGGLVVLTAKGLDEVMRTVVNNTGEVKAQTIANKEGKIYLLGGMENDRIEVGGTLDASAPNGGNGGFVETSAADVRMIDGRRVTTDAANGSTGTWLIDPNDYTIAASGGNITGTQLGTDLVSNNVVIATASQGTAGGNGDIFVNDTVTWSSNNSLTLTAERDININQNITATGLSAKVALHYGQGGSNTATYNIAIGKKINLQAGQNFDTKLGANAVTNWTVITALGDANHASVSGYSNSLQALAYSTNLGTSGRYVLGADIDASATSTWNTNTGWTPIGNYTTNFRGHFDGLGHTISNLFIDRSTLINNQPSGPDRTDFFQGLFGLIRGASISNIELANANVTGRRSVGALVGEGSTSTESTITNARVTGTSSVKGRGKVGGLAGFFDGSVTGSSSSATVEVLGAGSGESSVGGLVGELSNNNDVSFIASSYATGDVKVSSTAFFYVGGLVGRGPAPISRSYATGNVGTNSIGVNGNGEYVGGLVGQLGYSLSESYATGNVVGSFNVGGLVGQMATNRAISNSYAVGNVTGSTDSTGGLVGRISSSGASIVNSFAAGLVSGAATNKGGLIGITNGGTVTNSYWDSTVNASGGASAGVGTGTLSAGTADGKTTADMQTITVFSGTLPTWDVVADASLTGVYPTLRWASSGLTAGSSIWVMAPVTLTYTVAGGSRTYGTGFTLPTPVITGGSPVATPTVKVYDSENVDVTSQALAGTLAVGTYTVKTLLNDTNYMLASSGNTDGVLTITSAAMPTPTPESTPTPEQTPTPTSPVTASGTTTDNAMSNVIANAITTPQTNLRPSLDLPGVRLPTGGSGPGSGQPSAFVNVINPLPAISAAFGNGERLAVVSSPSASEPTQAITLTQARTMMQSPVGGASEGARDVRVPVSRNSLADIVNGGVRLPSGVEQELFVVQAN